MSLDFTLTLEHIDRQLYTQKKDSIFARYPADEKTPPRNNQTENGLTEECLAHISSLLTKKGRQNIVAANFLFIHFGGWDFLLNYAQDDTKRRGYLLRCENIGYSVSHDRALMDAQLTDSSENTPASPSPVMRGILEANIFIVKHFCDPERRVKLSSVIRSFLASDPADEKELYPQIAPEDRYALFRYIQLQLSDFDAYRRLPASPENENRACTSLGTALAFLCLTALLRDSVSHLCSLLPAAVQAQRIREKSLSRGEVPLAAPASRAPHAVPTFIGRERELEFLKKHFAEKRGIVFISGEGGSGKTQLACRAAEAYSGGTVIFAPYEENLVHTIAAISFAGDPAFGKPSEQDRFDRNLNAITRTGGACLLVIDGFDSPEDTETFAELLGDTGDKGDRGTVPMSPRFSGTLEPSPCLPCLPPCHPNRDVLSLLSRTGADILITTRTEVPAAYASVCLSGDDHLLSVEELVELSRRIYRNHLWDEAETKKLEKLILSLDRHVMAVDLIMSALQYSSGFSSLDEVQEKVDSIHYEEIGGVASTFYGEGHRGSGLRQGEVYPLLKELFSFSAYEEETKRLLRLLSLLPGGGLSRGLFMEFAQAEAEKSRLLYLRDLHLISVGERIIMHKVLADLAVEELGPDAASCGAFLEKALGYYVQYSNKIYDLQLLSQTASLLARCYTILSKSLCQKQPPSPKDAESLADAAPEPAASDGRPSHICARNSLLLPAIACRISLIAHYCGEYRTADEWGRRAVKLAEQENDTTLQVDAYKGLAQVRSYEGNHKEALLLFKKALELQLKDPGEFAPETAVTYNDIAVSCIELMDYASAGRFLRKAKRIQKEKCGEYSAEISTTYHNLGYLYSSEGNNARAALYYKKALKAIRDAYGPRHPEMAATCSNIGEMLCEAGEYEEAQAYLSEALAINTELFGESYAGNAVIYNNLAMLFGSMGDDDLALSFSWKSLELQKKAFGEWHVRLAAVYRNIAVSYRWKKEPLLAAEYYKKALAVLEKNYGRGSVRLEEPLKELIDCCKELGDREEELRCRGWLITLH